MSKSYSEKLTFHPSTTGKQHPYHHSSICGRSHPCIITGSFCCMGAARIGFEKGTQAQWIGELLTFLSAYTRSSVLFQISCSHWCFSIFLMQGCINHRRFCFLCLPLSSSICTNWRHIEPHSTSVSFYRWILCFTALGQTFGPWTFLWTFSAHVSALLDDIDLCSVTITG